MIHEEDPFASMEDDPTRRFRGRLASSVTIITAGTDDKKTGLTVSSLFVVDGDPALVYAVVGPNSDLYDTVTRTGAFAVHVCHDGQAGLADVFAGIRPNPGGLFAGSEYQMSEWGPLLTSLPNRALCRTVSTEDSGWSGVLIGSIEEIEFTDITDPLLHFRGSYRSLG